MSYSACSELTGAKVHQPNTYLCRAIPHTLVLEHVSPATRLLEKRRQMFEVQEALEQQKIEFNRKVRYAHEFAGSQAYIRVHACIACLQTMYAD